MDPVASRYELRNRLGSGGMGDVYRAWDSILQREVALKLLRDDLPVGSQGRARMLREARMAATLSHPNICVVHDVGEVDGRPFVTMELLGGETLRGVLSRQGSLEIDQAGNVARGVAAALAAAHIKGIVHRDIKPENIMLLPDGRVKVLDFGLAKPVEAMGRPATDHVMDTARTTLGPGGRPITDTSPIEDASLTTPGQIMGTYHYLSPEQAEARPADARSDVFSFGVVLYEMLAGKRPFEGETFATLLAAIRAGEPTPLKSARPDTPAPLVQVVERCLKKEPAQRFPSGSEITSTLETILAVTPRKAGRLAAALIAIAVIGSGVAAVTWSTLNKTAGWGRAAAGGGPPVTRQITFEGKAIYPFYSPDGSLIAHRTFVEGHQTTRIMPAEGGPERSVEEPPGDFFLTGWNLAGDAVLGAHWVAERAETWEIPIAGGPGKRILQEGGHACFHPDGRTVAYDGPGATHAPFMREVRVRDLGTGEERRAAPPGDQPKDCQNPKWSPDGSLLAFWCFDPAGGGNSLHVEDFDLTDDRIVEMKGFVPGGGYFGWGPDGKSVFVEGVESGERSIWRVPVDRPEEKPEQLVRTQDALQSFTVHPSGHKLVYAGTTNATEIAVGDLSMPDDGWTYRSSPLTNSLVFGAEAQDLLYTQMQNGRGVINSIPIKGGAPTALTEKSGLSCDSPLALDARRFACVCAPRASVGAELEHAKGTIQELYEMDRVTGSMTRLWGLEALIDVFGVSPSGRSLLLHTLEEDPITGRVRVYDRITGEVVTVFTGEGQSIVDTGWTDQENEIFVMNQHDAGQPTARMDVLRIDVKTLKTTTVVSVQGTLQEAVMSADASRLLYITGPNIWLTELWLLEPGSGSPARRVTDFRGAGQPTALSLSPDGMSAAFIRRRSTSDLYLVEGF